MGGKATWPQLGQKTQNTNEQGTLLLVNTRECIKRMEDKEKPPPEVVQEWLKAYLTYLEDTQFSPANGELVKAIDSMTSQYNRSQSKMEESNAIIRHGITELTTSLKSSSPLTNKAGPRNWAAVAATPPAPRTTVNKNTEIIVRLNDADKKQQLSQYETGRIAKDINVCIAEKDIQAKHIRAVKKLPSGDLAIHAVNAEEAEKLRDNSAWTAVLGKRAKAVVQTHAVMVSGIEIKKFDLTTAEGRETAMRRIREENEDVEELRGMEILYVSWRNKPTAVQQYHTMVIEVTTPEMGNAMLDNSMMVGGELRACSVFNKACRTVQCYKCHQHGHTTVQCTKEERCGYCAGAHATREKKCAEGYKTKCCVCGGAHNPWRKECREKQKEIERIRYQLSITPARFAVQRQQYTIVNKAITEPMDTSDGSPEPIVVSEGFSQLRDLEQRGIEESRAQRAFLDETNKRRKTVTNGPSVPVIQPIEAMIPPQIPPSSQGTRGRSDRSASPIKGRKTPTARKRIEESEKGGSFSTTINRTPLGDVTNRHTRSNPPEEC